MMLGQVATEVAIVGGQERAVAERAHRAPLAMTEERRRQVEELLIGAGEPSGEIDILEPGRKVALVEAADRLEDGAPQGERRRRRLLDRRAGGGLVRAAG